MFLFSFTRERLLGEIGLLIILFGCFSVIVGFVYLASHIRVSVREGALTKRQAGFCGLLAGALLLVNFPMAGLYVSWGLEIDSRFTVTVINDGGAVVQNFAVQTPAERTDFGPIGPGRSSRRVLYIGREGALTYELRRGGGQTTGILSSYLNVGEGGEALVRVGASDEIQISE
ncbi:MAG: hypothetical protein K1X53_14255 [Candidatus Sumerlaeaceae bacterium]|nr:hypothetical protein [Candidatus Sumerlaeaceae bacterium]